MPEEEVVWNKKLLLASLVASLGGCGALDVETFRAGGPLLEADARLHGPFPLVQAVRRLEVRVEHDVTGLGRALGRRRCHEQGHRHCRDQPL